MAQGEAAQRFLCCKHCRDGLVQDWKRRGGLESTPLSLGQCLGNPVIDFSPEEPQEYFHTDPPHKPSSTFP